MKEGPRTARPTSLRHDSTRKQHENAHQNPSVQSGAITIPRITVKQCFLRCKCGSRRNRSLVTWVLADLSFGHSVHKPKRGKLFGFDAWFQPSCLCSDLFSTYDCQEYLRGTYTHAANVLQLLLVQNAPSPASGDGGGMGSGGWCPGCSMHASQSCTIPHPGTFTRFPLFPSENYRWPASSG